MSFHIIIDIYIQPLSFDTVTKQGASRASTMIPYPDAQQCHP